MQEPNNAYELRFHCILEHKWIFFKWNLDFLGHPHAVLMHIIPHIWQHEQI